MLLNSAQCMRRIGGGCSAVVVNETVDSVGGGQTRVITAVYAPQVVVITIGGVEDLQLVGHLKSIRSKVNVVIGSVGVEMTQVTVGCMIAIQGAIVLVDIDQLSSWRLRWRNPREWR